MMTADAWMHEVTARIAQSEGYRPQIYCDSLGVHTIGIGFNMERDDAGALLSQCGASLQSCLGGAVLNGLQVYKLFALSFAPIVAQARSSLEATHFDNLSDARRFVICDLVYNLGLDGWLAFAGTRRVLDGACHLSALGEHDGAHVAFGIAADHLAGSLWAQEVGDRAKRDIAMLRSSNWVAPGGDGTS